MVYVDFEHSGVLEWDTCSQPVCLLWICVCLVCSLGRRFVDEDLWIWIVVVVVVVGEFSSSVLCHGCLLGEALQTFTVSYFVSL